MRAGRRTKTLCGKGGGEWLTGVYFTTEAEGCLSKTCANHGAVLGFVVDDFGLSILYEVSRTFCPRSGQCRQRLEFVS